MVTFCVHLLHNNFTWWWAAMIRIIFMGIIILGNNEFNHSLGYHYSWQQWNRPAPIVSSTWTRILLGVAWKLIESIFMIINHRYPPLQQHNLLSIDIHTLEWICRREWKQLWPLPVPSGKQLQACSWGKFDYQHFFVIKLFFWITLGVYIDIYQTMYLDNIRCISRYLSNYLSG